MTGTLTGFVDSAAMQYPSIKVLGTLGVYQVAAAVSVPPQFIQWLPSGSLTATQELVRADSETCTTRRGQSSVPSWL